MEKIVKGLHNVIFSLKPSAQRSSHTIHDTEHSFCGFLLYCPPVSDENNINTGLQNNFRNGGTIMSITYTAALSHLQASMRSPVRTSSESSAKTADTAGTFKDLVQESVVDEYKRKHPDHASHVDQQVKAGRAVREKNAAGISTENMTMAEYQAWFFALLDTIPYDSTRVNDTTTITISDKGWEQMRKDPDYEAWILGYFVEDRAVRNPFFGWGNNEGCVIFERFGASIEEPRGDGFSKSALNGSRSDDDDDDDVEDWWIKRHKRMKKLLKEQVERDIKRDIAKRSVLQEEYSRQQYISSQRQHSFLTSGTVNAPGVPLPKNPASSLNAALTYTSILDLFGSNMRDV